MERPRPELRPSPRADQARVEHAFTLIELLVVMIIIAILMAIAVPTFLAQKSNAVKSKTLQNIEMMKDAIEACAVGNQDGSYTGCSEHVDLFRFEPSLQQLPICCPSGVQLDSYDVNGVVDGVRRAVPVPGEYVMGYEFITWLKDGDKKVWFQLVHWDDGTVSRRCGEGLVFPAMNTSPSPGVPGSRVCTTGKW